MKRTLGAIALISTIAVPGLAQAAAAIATSDVNLRAGPSTNYPVVTVVDGGDNVRVFGCLEAGDWCDVAYSGARGWVSSNYLAYLDNGRRYTSRVPERVGAPVITFSFGSYWDDHYRSRGFYRDRGRWDPRHGRYDRGERHDRRGGRHDRWDDDRRHDRWDRRESRREDRQLERAVRRVERERRDVQEARERLDHALRSGRGVRWARRELREQRRELQEARAELRHERRD